MKLKKQYTLSFDSDLAELIEVYKEKNNLTYTEFFIKAVEMILEVKKNE